MTNSQDESLPTAGSLRQGGLRGAASGLRVRDRRAAGGSIAGDGIFCQPQRARARPARPVWPPISGGPPDARSRNASRRSDTSTGAPIPVPAYS
jgi:hypothetical protein